jgi:hypothetical protein
VRSRESSSLAPRLQVNRLPLRIAFDLDASSPTWKRSWCARPKSCSASR